VTDPRVRHVWDREHRIARQLARDARSPQPEPECCTRDGILWDLVAVYPPAVVWTETMPPAVLFDGPVLHKQSELDRLVAQVNGRAALEPSHQASDLR